MKRVLAVILVVLVSGCLFGCGKKQAGIEETQEPMTIEAITTLAPTGTAEVKAVEVKPIEVKAAAQPIEPPTPAGPFKPTSKEIQQALKNAGLYLGAIDGKVGPKTKKAIEEFQKTNGLKVDGKVGAKTWAVLSKYLSAESARP